jgi:hypothetical protein
MQQISCMHGHLWTVSCTIEDNNDRISSTGKYFSSQHFKHRDQKKVKYGKVNSDQLVIFLAMVFTTLSDYEDLSNFSNRRLNAQALQWNFTRLSTSCLRNTDAYFLKREKNCRSILLLLSPNSNIFPKISVFSKKHKTRNRLFSTLPGHGRKSCTC